MTKFFKLQFLLSFVFLMYSCSKESSSSSTPVTPVVYDLLSVKDFPVKDSNYSSVYFIVTDELANVLAEIKFDDKASDFKITTDKPVDKERLNVYVVRTPVLADLGILIVGYLQVKKGSTYTLAPKDLPPNYSTTNTLRIKCINATDFLRMSASTDVTMNEVKDAKNWDGQLTCFYGNRNKAWVQIEKADGAYYDFINFPDGATVLDVDVSKLTKKPVVKRITAPEPISYAYISAWEDKSYRNHYSFGNVSANSSGLLDYSIPSEPFQLYSTFVQFTSNFKFASVNEVGSSVATKVTPLEANFSVQGTSLSNFKPVATGTFDYYKADFESKNSGPKVYAYLWSPSAAQFSDFKLPDLSKYTGGASVDPAQVKLRTFALYQVEGFDEKNFSYPSTGNNRMLNEKQLFSFYNN